MSGGAGLGDRALLWGIAATQVIGWGSMYTSFPLLVAPMEAELGWSRVLLNAGFTAGLLASGLAAVPAGKWVDRHGARGLMDGGALLAALLLLALSLVRDPVAYVAIWVALGLVQAACLWNTAMAVVVAEAREPTRTITAITFITGFTGTVFLPVTEGLIAVLGWRGALQALAALQAGSALIAFRMLCGARVPAAPRDGAQGVPLRRRIGERAFLGLALCFAAHAFLGTGLAAHLIPLLRERGWPEAMVLLLAAAHGPAQVAARALLFAAGHRVTMRAVGRFATGLLPVAMLALAAGPASLPLTLLFVGCWAVADGLLTIVRAAGTAEILGREGYGAVTGALSAFAVLPRTVAPLVLALIWDGAGGYGPVPWLLAAVALAAAGGFFLAASAQSAGRDGPAAPPT